MADSLTLLVLSDIHYQSHADPSVAPEAPRYRIGLELARRAIIDAKRLCEPDAIVVLGDTISDENDPWAETDLAATAALLRDSCATVIAVPGNHDGDAARFMRIFGERTGAHIVKGYNLYTFADPYAAEDESMTRPAAATQAFLGDKSGAPVITIQHSPIYPDVDSSNYPFMPLNRAEIIRSYKEKGVLLSLSGHYHEGQPPASLDGAAYFNIAALNDAPFPYAIVRISGRDVQIENRQLKAPEFSQFFDGHIHTHFGYCAVDVHPTPVRERMEMFGVKSGFFIEHAPQLYLTDDEFWHARHVEEPERIRKARQQGTDRMGAYRAGMKNFAVRGFGFGVEVELDRNGQVTLLEEDRQGWDRILGAVHWIPSNMRFDTPSNRAATFMALVEGMARQGINALAHPFRYFGQKRFPRPTELYRPLAKLLAAHNIAAEVNFHLNNPDPEFFSICLEEGVRIELGTDSHELYEVGDLNPHIRFLKQIGAI